MSDTVADQLENNRRQQEQIRRNLNRYSNLVELARIRLMQLTKEQINLKVWRVRNEIQEAENVDCETIDEGTQEADAERPRAHSEKGKKGGS